MRCSLVLIAIALLCPVGSSKDIFVPGHYSSIQAAIDGASDGDNIFVHPGTYREKIDYKGKAVWIRSISGSGRTIIDSGQRSPVVRFQSNEGRESILEGFTITNGKTYSGREGGGIQCFESSPTVRGNVISWNTAPAGGGIRCFFPGSPLITGNVIIWNKASAGGGAISSYASEPVITDNIVLYNMGGSNGGAFSVSSGSSGYPLMANNIIAYNSANTAGGLLIHQSDLELVNNTITWNAGLKRAGGIEVSEANVTITNTILWHNMSPEGKEIWVGGYWPPATATVRYSDVHGGLFSVWTKDNSTLYWDAATIIDADPLFIDPSSNDFHIPFDSPCRSAGDRHAVNLPDTDFEGDPRTGLFAFPDLGADEFHTRFYVNGRVSQGETVTGVIIGWPKTSPVVLISGSGILQEPAPTPYGDFWLLPPWDHRLHFNPIPDNGVRLVERLIATGLPPGTQIPFQALVGTELSNPWVVEIEKP